MKRTIAIPVLLAASLALASAQTPNAPGISAAAPAAAQAGSGQIAVIAFQTAVSQTNEFQRKFADLQRKYEPRRQQLKTLSDEIDSLSKQLQDQGEKLTDAERAARVRTLDEKNKQFDRQKEDAQSGFQQEMQELYLGTASKVFDLLSSYAEQRGFTVVLDFGQQQTPILYIGMPSMNITQAIIDAYNVQSGVPAPPQAAPNAPAPAGATPPASPKPRTP